jgi:hypothetical protein
VGTKQTGPLHMCCSHTTLPTNIWRLLWAAVHCFPWLPQAEQVKHMCTASGAKLLSMQTQSIAKGHQSSCRCKVLPTVVWQCIVPVCQCQCLAWATCGSVPPYVASSGAAPTCTCTMGNNCPFSQLIVHSLPICIACCVLITYVHSLLHTCHLIIVHFHSLSCTHCPIITMLAHQHALLR